MLSAGAGGVPRWSQPARQPSFIVDRPMPATKAEIEELRGYLRWAQQHRGESAVRERVLADALQKALAYLEEPDARQNVVRFVLAGLFHSVVKRHGMYIIRDRDLNTWSHDQLAELFGPTDDEEFPK